MAYNRLCVSISDETKERLTQIMQNKKIKAVTKSAIVELALLKMFDELSDKDIETLFLEEM